MSTTPRLSEILRTIGGPRAFSLISLVIVAVISVPASLIQITGFGDLPVATRIGTIAVNAVSVSVLFLLYWWLHRVNGRPQLPVLLVLLAYASLGLLRAMTPAVGARLGWLPDLEHVGLRTGQSVLGAVLLFSACSITLGYFDRQTESITMLTNQAADLTELRSGARDHLNATTRQTSEVVESEITPVLDDLTFATQQAIATPDPSTATALAQRLRESAKQVVRPLSHALILGSHPPVSAIAPGPAIKSGDWPTRLVLIASTVTTATGYRALLTSTLWFFALLGPVGYAVGLGAAALGLAPSACLGWLLMTLANRLLLPVLRRTTRPVAAIVWIFGVVVVGAATGLLASAIVNMVDPVAQLKLLAASLVVTTALSLLVSISAAVSLQIDRTRRDLQTTIETRALEVAGLDEASKAIQRQIGSFLHGSVQATMVANAMRLNFAAETDDASTIAEAIREAQLDVAKVRDELQATSNPPSLLSLGQMLTTIADRWYPLIQLVTDPLPPVPNALTGVITDVVAEAVLNAAKHGNATEVRVRVAIDDTAIELIITDNGRTSMRSDHDSSGIGLAQLSDVGSVALERQREGARLLVRIPLSAVTTSGQSAAQSHP